MPIKQKLAKVAAATKATSNSTHGGNEDKVTMPTAGAGDLKNHMSATDTLIDPEDNVSGSTHTSVKASTDEQNISTLDSDVDPAAGYLEGASVDEGDDASDDELEEELDEEEVDASLEAEDTLENNNGDTPIEADSDDGDVEEGDDADWDAPPVEDDAPTVDDIEDDAEDEGDMDDEGEDDVADIEDAPAAGEELSLLDVDEVDDADVASVAFASFGTRLMVIRANRIIATMTKRMAVASRRDDVYMSDQFQEVAASELSKKGLRKGLKTMGFALAKVNVTKASVVNARVELAVHKTTAAVRKVTASKEAAFQQSLTIAAVGINRRYFNDQPNELKEYLETSLAQAGVRGGAKMLQAAFGKFGPAYAKSIVELATKIAAMPQASRDGFVGALDLTSDDMDTPEEDVVPIGFESVEGDEDDSEFADDTVTASLATPGSPRRVTASVATGKYSLAASAILSGDKPLFM